MRTINIKPIFRSAFNLLDDRLRVQENMPEEEYWTQTNLMLLEESRKFAADTLEGNLLTDLLVGCFNVLEKRAEGSKSEVLASPAIDLPTAETKIQARRHLDVRKGGQA